MEEKAPRRKTDNKMVLSLKYRRKMRREISRRELRAATMQGDPRFYAPLHYKFN